MKNLGRQSGPTPQFNVTRNRNFWALQQQKRNRERRDAAEQVNQLVGENGNLISGENSEPIKIE